MTPAIITLTCPSTGPPTVWLQVAQSPDSTYLPSLLLNDKRVTHTDYSIITLTCPNTASPTVWQQAAQSPDSTCRPSLSLNDKRVTQTDYSILLYLSVHIYYMTDKDDYLLRILFGGRVVKKDR